MRRWLLVLIALLVLGEALQHSNAQNTPSLEPVYRTESSSFSVDVFSAFLKQGRVGLIRVNESASAPEATFLNRTLSFFQVPPDTISFYAFITAPLNASQREHYISVTIASGEVSETLQVPITITSGGFIQQSVIVVGEANDLLNREIEDEELTRIFELAAPVTHAVYWQGVGFSHPINTELTSPFGAVRLFNGTYETLHTGWDYQAPLGKPMVASSGGQVVFAGRLPIRGNYVLVDHGYGVYSGYAHLSVAHVTQGQIVTARQIIGQVGSTGRSSSAHAHIEFIVNEQWIDSRDFLSFNLPR